jgi:hypothetical protein
LDALKAATIERIKNLPDGVSVEDIMYEIDFIGQVLEGIQDADKGKTISTEELLARADEWENILIRKGLLESRVDSPLHFT